ncbi:MAG TPA: DinB family protein [Planctomycetota bacterium]|nr:DinB family protein [Planctomycetota bacterium]
MFTSVKGFIEWYGRELRTTRSVVAALKDKGLPYKPDPKARTAGELAWHLVTAPRWFLGEVMKLPLKDDFAKKWSKPAAKTAAILQAFDHSSATCLKAVETKKDPWLSEMTDFIGSKMPNGAILAILLHHEIHHRGQLCVYLRPIGSKVPGIYGPSADS